MFEDAINEARIMDTEMREGKIRGPLHGIPISLKDMVKCRGSVSTIGMSAYAD